MGCCEEDTGIWRSVKGCCKQDIGTWRSVVGCCEQDIGTWRSGMGLLHRTLQYYCAIKDREFFPNIERL